MLNLMPRSFYLDDIFDEMDKERKLTNQMRCDIYETNNAYHIEMDIPGYNKNEIKIECNDGILTITAEKRYENHEEHKDKKKYLRKERYYGKTSRSFSFTDIDEDKIEATFENGTLLLTIPIKSNEKTKKIISIN